MLVEPLKYRPEIDGLRALAVVPVILFHAGFDAFRGGFVGVDVFFVISGYLITLIIEKECREGRFSIVNFYERRARRILPALFVVTTACLPFAWAWMLPVETVGFARSELATLTFVPNIYFWAKTSYFGTAAEKLPLLHTWSLGVEEQFYVLYPLFIVAMWRSGVRACGTALVVVACVSFGASEWAWRAGKISSDFFFAPTRAWELLLGALVALVSQRRPIYAHISVAWSNAASLAGLALLAYSVAQFDKNTPTPSFYALLPTVGASLIIAFAVPGTAARYLLSRALMVRIGLISYSAYLWHQPLLAFARLRMIGELSWQVVSILCVASLVLAYCTWRYVEIPFRRPSVVPRGLMIRSLLSAWLVLVGIGLASEASDGFSGRTPIGDRSLAALADTDAQGRYVLARFASLDRDFTANGGSEKVRVLVIGDSFAEDFVNAIFESRLLATAEIRTFYISPTCQIYIGQRDVAEFVSRSSQPDCARARASRALEQRIGHADVIILAASWAPWAAKMLPDTLLQLTKLSRAQVFVVGPKRIGDINIRELLSEPLEARLQEAQPFAARTIELDRTLALLTSPDRYVRMQEAICGHGPQCRLFTPEGSLISYDGVHLTKEGAAFAGRNVLAGSPLARFVENFRR